MNGHERRKRRLVWWPVGLHTASRRLRGLRAWAVLNALLAGVLAVVWLILRSGAKPSRLAYPCQQAALGTATMAFGVPLGATLFSLRRRLVGALRAPAGKGLAAGAIGLAACICVLSLPPAARSVLDPPADYTAHLYVVDNVGSPSGDHFPALDSLITLMGSESLKFYRSATTTVEAGPDGLIRADDVVLIKINQQWSRRGGTNTDLLRGLIARIVEHPDGFAGEIVVVENGQGMGSFRRSENNAEDHGQSPLDVVNDFATQGHTISAYLWDPIKDIYVSEYSDGDITDGYVVFPNKDPETQVNVSYPKFQTASGTYISLRHGIWNPGTTAYEQSHLRFINVPVLKGHGEYGVTACVKNYMGVVTGKYPGSIYHDAVRRGGLGSFLAEVRAADLNILDCIWVCKSNDFASGWIDYDTAMWAGALVAALDPVAADIWAAKHVLLPTLIANGHDIDYVRMDPEDPSSEFRNYLDLSMSEMLAGGITTTNDLDHIVAYHVHLPDPLVADAGPDPIIGPGELVELQGAATGGQIPHTYLWQPELGLDNPAALNPTASPDSTATYMLTVTDAQNQVDQDTVVVFVTNPADFDRDGEVGLSDYDPLFLEAWGGTDAKYDLAGGGDVFLLDYYVFLDSYGWKLPPHAVCYWSFDELSGADVFDSSGHGNHGTAMSGATRVSGRVGGALSFDGVDDYVSIGSDLSQWLGGTATLCAWVSTTASGDNTKWHAPGLTGVEQADGADDVFWGWLDASGRICVGAGDGASATSTAAINDGSWHHVGFTRDSLTGGVSVYVDGVLHNSSLSEAGDKRTSFCSLGRIEDTGGTSEYYHGLLDEVRIYDTVLSAAEIASLATGILE